MSEQELKVSKTFMKNYYNTKLVNLMEGLTMVEEWVEELSMKHEKTPVSKIIAEAKRSKLIKLHLEVAQAISFVKNDIILLVKDGNI